MAKFVIKKDGAKEPFDPEKIKRGLFGAAKKANLSQERINEVVQQVSDVVMQLAEGKEEIPTTEIRDKILSELDIIEPSISEGWRQYQKEKVKI